jgi:predicted MPP superfamily phosphohydrolase
MELITEAEVSMIVELKEKGFTWGEIAEKITKKFGIKRTLDSVRNSYRRYSDIESTPQSVVRNIKDAHRARRGKASIARDNKILIENQIRQEDFLQEFEALIKKNKPILYKPTKPVSKKSTERVVVMHLSDMHFQAQIDEGEMGGLNKYGSAEEARRLALFTREVADYKLQHRDHTELMMVINGDILQGVIHDIESTPTITTQVSATMHLLGQSISYLSNYFKKVKVVCTSGNHERMMHKSNKGRQTRQKWDSYSTIVYAGLKMALAAHKNVEFVIPETPYAYVDVLGHKFFITHSDTVLNIGYPGKSIDIQRAKNIINDLKEGIGEIDVVLVGHVHVDCKNILPNGTVLMSNGSMSGIDEFALSLGITSNNPTQQIFEVTKNHPVGDMRSVKLSVADKNKDLEKIIKPFNGKF